MYLVEEEGDDVSEETLGEQGQGDEELAHSLEISLYALWEHEVPQLMRVEGWLRVDHQPAFDVVVGNGSTLKCKGRSVDEKLEIQGHGFSVQLYTLAMVGAYLVLGIHWLKGLGEVLKIGGNPFSFGSTVKLDGLNYEIWSRSFMMSVTGHSGKYASWEEDNNMVMSWIMNLVGPYLAGLNDEFENVRSQILNSEEAFSIEDVYSRVEAEEQSRVMTGGDDDVRQPTATSGGAQLHLAAASHHAVLYEGQGPVQGDSKPKPDTLILCGKMVELLRPDLQHLFCHLRPDLKISIYAATHPKFVQSTA
ncbi:Mediator of RNA polymerase II transcription subunit 23 [Nymphaea thermarum]|nr:Mediator of RNA polymerase II transcription subunit 23 [Nymphaea thermarum]